MLLCAMDSGRTSWIVLEAMVDSEGVVAVLLDVGVEGVSETERVRHVMSYCF